MRKAIQRAIEFLCILVVELGMIAVDVNPLLPLAGLALAWPLWSAKVAIFGEDAPEPINEDEQM